jgi:hypothetical protein
LVQYLDHFGSFNRVESLTLSHLSYGAFDKTPLQTLFRGQIPSVRKLRLYYPTACPVSILQFISIFTNLRDTVVHAPHWVTTPRRGGDPTTSHTLQGELHLSGLGEDAGPFFSLLASQTTRYEQIVLDGCALSDFYPLQLFISNAGVSLRTLYIFAEGNRKLGLLLSALHILTLRPTDRREVPKLSLSDCAVLEHLFISVVGPETKFRRISSTLSSITSSYFRKLILELNLRELPHIHCEAVKNVASDSVSRLDRPLAVLAQNAVRDRGRFLFVLVMYNALEFAQKLTGLNKEGDILAGDKVVGGDHSCVYIPASTPLGQALVGTAGTPCDLYDFL